RIERRGRPSTWSNATDCARAPSRRASWDSIRSCSCAPCRAGGAMPRRSRASTWVARARTRAPGSSAARGGSRPSGCSRTAGAGSASRLERPGDYFLREIAGESIIVLRDRSGTLRAFFNVCRHRGTRLCSEESGRLGETLQCSYHAWTYATDGRLVGAPHMQDVPGFDKADYPLHAAAIAEWEGFLFVNLAEQPAPFDRAWAALQGRFARFGLPALVAGLRVAYDVAATCDVV